MNPFAIFRKPSARTLAQVELEEAQRQLLLAQSSAEYATAMAAYHNSRIERLQAMLQETSPPRSFLTPAVLQGAVQ